MADVSAGVGRGRNRSQFSGPCVGRPLALKWRMEIAETECDVLATINFAELALGEARHLPRACARRRPRK